MKKKKFWAWFWVALCTLAIFLVVPLARTIQRFVSAHWGRSLFGYIVLVAVGIAFIAVIYVIYFRMKVKSPSRLLCLSGVAGLYVFFTLKLWQIPEEAVHFLEYGLLGFLLFRALSLTIRDKSVYITAFLIASLVGIFDEILQWIMPGRYWDFRDAGLNALAAGLFLIALWKGFKPGFISERISPSSCRRVSSLLGANLILLGLCASNTPTRVAAYASRLPLLSPLLKEEPMYEFSRRHVDQEVGVFYSRLSLEELAREDRERADHHAEILREWKNREYSQFLTQFTPLLHPFLYEMRVHIFRRDRKEEEALVAKKGKRAAQSLFVAWKENLILEKYFGQTLTRSSYAWEEEKKKQIQAQVETNRPYSSPVSRGIIYMKEKTVWLGILGALGLILTVYFLWENKSRRDFSR